MKRDIIQVLIDWKTRSDRKPLILRGARQVGKTFAIEEFAKAHFTNYLKINLEEKPDLKKLFRKPDTKQIITELSILFNTEITNGESLLFIDEIQTCPEAIVSLRYFKEQQPGLHVMAAGSLLDHTLNEMRYSMPVGRVEFAYMYPMSFKEFLLALSENKLIEYVNKFSFGNDFSELIHQKLSEYVRLYFFIGGMPEAVYSYIKTKKLVNIKRSHSSIITLLQYDFAKYGTKKQQEHLMMTMQYCVRNIGNKVKYSNINGETRSELLKTALHKLEMSRIIHKVKHTNSHTVPLINQEKDNIFKLLFLDLGLINHIGNIQLVDIDKLLVENEGALAEQFIGQEMLNCSMSYIDAKLNYWTRQEKNSNAEVDYLFQHKNRIYPIEVKAGKSGGLKSLHIYLYEKKLNTGIRFNMDIPSRGDFTVKVRAGKQQAELKYELISLPLYMCWRIKELIEIERE
ncbi:MAG: AAA family ATPase [Bacteroidota bacterium]|nr:AAA family ATPase [Bacteroidota bacterium]